MVDRLTRRPAIERLVWLVISSPRRCGAFGCVALTARRSVQDDHHLPAGFTGFHDAMSFPDVTE
jgi:hypothetical protein